MERRTFLKLMVEGAALTLIAPSLPVSKPFEITEADIRNAKLLEPGWYKVTVDGFAERESKRRAGEKLIAIEMTTVTDKVAVTQFVNETFPAPLIITLQKCGIDVTQGTVDLDEAIGKEIEVRIENVSYRDKLFNAIKPFAHKGEREYSR